MQFWNIKIKKSEVLFKYIGNNVVIVMDEKKQLIFNAIFDIYKIFLGAGLTLLVAVIVKVAFSEGTFTTGLTLMFN